MGLFDRLRRGAAKDDEDRGPEERAQPDQPGTPPEDLPLTPEARPLGEQERARIHAGLEALAAEGVDVESLQELGDGLDRALATWMAEGGSDHDVIVERYAVGIGEHLARHTDLSWKIVTDVFGTDLGLASGDFVVVPGNLVAARWMRRETGWVPGVVSHLVQVRSR